VRNGEAGFEVVDRAADGVTVVKDGIEVREILLLRGETAELACVLHLNILHRALGSRECKRLCLIQPRSVFHVIMRHLKSVLSYKLE
jgi:hypothetical protein